MLMPWLKDTNMVVFSKMRRLQSKDCTKFHGSGNLRVQISH